MGYATKTLNDYLKNNPGLKIARTHLSDSGYQFYRQGLSDSGYQQTPNTSRPDYSGYGGALGTISPVGPEGTSYYKKEPMSGLPSGWDRAPTGSEEQQYLRDSSASLLGYKSNSAPYQFQGPEGATGGALSPEEANRPPQSVTAAGNHNPDYKKQYDAARQLVEGRYQQAENKLQEDYSASQPAYQKERDYISQQAAQTGKQMENYYSNLGLGRSGSMVGARANIANARQQGINNVNLQQRQAAQQLTNRLAELRQGRATDLAALEGREGQDLRNYDLALAQLLGRYGDQQTLAGQNTALQQALAEAGLTGMYNGQQTLPAQQQAWQQQYAQNQANQAYMGMLLNLLSNQAQHTGSWTMPSGFTYGDALNALLQRYRQGVY